MLMASNESSKTAVMRESVLDIVLLNDVSFEFAIISTLTASQNKTVHIWLVFGKFSDPPFNSNLLEKISMIVKKWHKK
jgi:hypothetical protein